MSTLPITTNPINPRPLAESRTAIQTERPARFVEPQTIYIQSVIAMTALFIVGIAVPTWIAMGDASFAIGLALFSAFWGGPGFGVMAGGARVAMQEARFEEQH